MFFTPCGIDDVDSAIEQFGAHGDRPPYILLGSLRDKDNYKAGVLCWADDQVSAENLLRVLGRFGTVDVERTEAHPDGPTFLVGVLRKVAWELRR